MSGADRYKTPQAFKTALEERVRKRAVAEGATIDRIRQLLIEDGETPTIQGTVYDGLWFRVEVSRAPSWDVAGLQVAVADVVEHEE